MEGDLLGVIRPEIIFSADGLYDFLVLEVIVEGEPDTDRDEWMREIHEMEIPIPKRATDIEIKKAVVDQLELITQRNNHTDRQRILLDSPLVGQDIRLED